MIDYSTLSIMRVYEQVQRRLSRSKQMEEYRYRVEVGDVEKWGEWVLAGVMFNDVDEAGMEDGRLAEFYVYHFRQGFQRITLKSTIQDKSYTILLEFQVAETEQNIPDFKDGGNYFFSHILETVTQTFNNKYYENELRDLYKLIELIDWNSEKSLLKTIRKKSLRNILLGLVVSNATLVWKNILGSKA